MRYYYPQYYQSASRFLTYHVVKRALERAGHVVTDGPAGCDAALVSICDVLDYPTLVKMKQELSIPVIVGGHYAVNYWSAILHSDYVWLGQVYEFAECQSMPELREHPSMYYQGKEGLAVSMRIDWGSVPLCQISTTRAYYWGGTGCRNKCKFCFTSWTNRHQSNPAARIKVAKDMALRKKIHLMVVSNDYSCHGQKEKTIDLLVREYLRNPVNASMVRTGIEFAAQETRARLGKPISNGDIYKMIQKMNLDNIAMRWFYISGYEDPQAFEDHVDMLCGMFHRHTNRRLVHMMFNNLQYQNYTPLYDERHDLDPSRYIDIKTTRRWYDKIRQYSKHILVSPPSPFQHVAARMGVELSTERTQIDYWLGKLRNAKNKLTMDQAHDSLIQTRVLETQKRSINLKTGSIKIH